MIRLDRTMDSQLLLSQELPQVSGSRGSNRHNKRLRNLHAWMAASLVLGAAFSLDACADYWFKVKDASRIQYLVRSPQICLGDLNTFDSTVLG
jgi:hypothetical protein